MLLSEIALRLATELRKSFGARILCPEDPLVGRIRNFYITTIYIKIERNSISIAKVKEFVKGLLLSFEADKLNKGSFVQVDVDPY